MISSSYRWCAMGLRSVSSSGMQAAITICAFRCSARIKSRMRWSRQPSQIAAGEDAAAAIGAIGALKGVPGRLEIAGERNGAMVIVDYAHKPEALGAALDALRPFATGRLICVFGCGGDRDRGKRPIMGRIAVDKADVVIVTDDNPRSERPEAIRAEILAAAAGAREIGDRGAAIKTAVGMLGAGDVLLVAGKGHETGQIVGDKVLPFSDQDAVREALGGEGGNG